MEKDLWNQIKEFYKEKFGFSDWALELMANREILFLFLSGTSSKKISEFLEIELHWVTEALQNTFNTEGWETDLPVNPYKLFLDLSTEDSIPEESIFCRELETQLAPYKLSLDCKRQYDLCVSFKLMEDKLEDEWV